MHVHAVTKTEFVLKHPGIGSIFTKYEQSVAAQAATETYLSMYRAMLFDPEWHSYQGDFYLAVENALADHGSEKVIPQPTICECVPNANYACGYCQQYFQQLEYFKEICFEVAASICIEPQAFHLFSMPGIFYTQVIDYDHILIGVHHHD
jgi:hypothetical protein